MKKYIFIISYLIFNFSSAQKVEKVFLEFNSDSNEFCDISKKDRGRYHSIVDTKKFIKTKSSLKNYSYRFYICKELFLSDKESDTCSINYLHNIKFSKIEDLKKKVYDTNPLYPYKVFPNLYLVEKINDSTIVKYKVKWEYYVE